MVFNLIKEYRNWFLSQSVQSLSRVQLFATPWTAARQASLSIANPWSLLRLMSIKLVMPCNHLILCHFLLLLPSVFLSIRVFYSELVLWIRWLKGWSFRTDFLEDGLVGSPCSPRDSQESSPTPQFKSINSSALSSLYSPALFIIQLSHPYMTTWSSP